MSHLLVMKFGGASVGQTTSFATVAKIIEGRKQCYQHVVVVVSAMGDTTDHLLTLAHEVHPNPPKRELDMLISVGERISTSLLAMSLDQIGIKAVSLTGSQCGIITSADHSNAKVVDVKPKRLLTHLEKGETAIVAGFQGMSVTGDITTLGRGGSDISAVALGVALGANKVEFYKDVPGIYSEDPRKNPQAQLYHSLTYSQAIEIINACQHQVLHTRSIFLAQKNNLPLHLLPFSPGSTQEQCSGTVISAPTAQTFFEQKYYEDSLCIN